MDKKDIDKYNEINSYIQRQIDRLMLSFLLTSDLDKDEFILAKVDTMFTENIVQSGAYNLEMYKNFKPTGGQLTNTKAKEIEFWHANITFDKLDVAIKRLLSSAVNRPDPKDAFIDAIIIWENLFGTKQGTSFRVTASLSKLIEKGNKKREVLFKDLRGLYNKRSRIVHGELELSSEEAEKCKKDAIKVAVKALKILYREKRDLIQYSSEVRSTKILLDTDSNDVK